MKKKTKTICKALSVFLAFLIVVQILPLQVLAESVTDAIAHQQFINDALNNPTSEDNISNVKILYEVEKKRDEYTKVYKKSDGTYTAVMTEEPLHYLNDGVWEEINNSMSLNGNLYTNLDNLFNVEFPETIDSNENLTVEKDGYELSFSVDNIEESSAVVENDIVVSDTNITVADEAIAQTQSSVTYNNVAEDTDLQYIITPNSIKENIIVFDKESVKDTYTFTFETNGLNVEKLDDGSVVFKDETNEVKFRIPRPVMTDAALAFSYDIIVTLIENADDTITLEYSPSSDWTNSSDRVYPITIDPAIMVENEGASWVEDTYVMYDSSNSDAQNTNGYNDYVGAVVNTTDNDGKQTHAEVYTKFNIDALKSLGDNIVFTEVQYLFIGISADGKALAKKITTPTDLTTVTYATKPLLDNEVIDYYTSPYSSSGEVEPSFLHFNITKPLNEWYNGAYNNGFAIVSGNEEYMGLFFLNGTPTTSTDSTTTYTTYVVMDYVDMGGYNENLNYHSQSVGRAGTGYVNDFTQHLSVIREDLSIDGNIMPVTVGMIYNSATYDKIKSLNYNTMMAYGNKWTPNYLRAFVQMADNQLTYYTESGSAIDYTYSVENGEVIFEETYSELYGEYGYEIEYFAATSTEPEYIVITRPDGFEERFNELGLLTSVTNSDYPSQKINIVYDSMFRINYITDGVGRKYDYVYNNTTNLLSKIKCYGANGEEIKAGSTTSPLEVNYAYDGNKNLTSVTFPDGKSATYTYNANGNLNIMRNIDGYQIVYSYDTNGKITNVNEQALESNTYVDGNSITYDCLSPTQIKLTDGNGNYETYQFNSNGTLLYTTDSNGNYTINNIEGSNDNSFFISANDYHVNAQNLLLNASFEDSATLTSHAKHWESTSSAFVRTSSNQAYCGDYVYAASKTNTSTVYQKQTVEVLSGGEYTFSAFVKSDETNPGKLFLNITSYNGSNTKTKSESISVESTSGEWERYWVALDTPSNTKKIVVEFGFKNTKGTFYIDNVQLEQSCSVNEYNYIENGGFRKDMYGWTCNTTYSIVGTEINDSNEKAVSFDRNIDGTNRIYQFVKINGDEGEVFTIGGWLKGCFVKSTTNNPIIKNLISDTNNGNKIFNFTNERIAQIDVYEYFEPEEDTDEENYKKLITIPFGDNIDDWQFAANSFTLDEACDELLVVLTSSNNANSISFSNIELTKNNNEFTINNDDSNLETTKSCPCSTCETPNCPCKCTHEAYCFCVSCLQKSNTITDSFGNITAINSFDGIKTLQTLTRFTGDGNYIFSNTFADGTVLTYGYDQFNGLLKVIEDGKGIQTSYEYDAFGTLTSISTEGSLAKYEYTNDKLTTLTYNDFSYNLKYDCWGQLIEISVEDQPIISYEYGEGHFRERINRTIYHNSDTNPTITEYIYDEIGNIIEIIVNEETQFYITYTSLGSIAEIIKVDCRTVHYTDYETKVYDADGKEIYTIEVNKDGYTVETISGQEYITKLYGVSLESSTGYVTESKDTIATNGKTIGTEAVQDCFGRYVGTTARTESVKDKNYHNFIAGVVHEYTYPEFDDKTTSEQIVEYRSTAAYGNYYTTIVKSNYAYSYEYDANGNIITIKATDADGITIIQYKYEYDNLNQLVTEIDYVNKIKYVYKYDDYNNDGIADYHAGNITSKKIYKIVVEDDKVKEEELQNTIEYSYDESEGWKDKLDSYNGQTIKYDNIGNITEFNCAKLNWSGIQLELYTIDDTDNNITKQIRYSYNEQGLIHCKTVWVKPFGSLDESYQLSEQYDYIWANGQLSNQVYTKYDNGTSTSYTIKFIYDVLNSPHGFIVNDSKTYLYLKNIQEDIIGIVDEYGDTVLSYNYNTWGVLTYSVDESDETIVQLTEALPLTYRGYYYDYDSGLYYIENRYYNPEIGRFINADSVNNIVSTNTILGFNVFTYCENNPVTHSLHNKNTSEYSTIASNYSYNKNISNKITGYIYNQDNEIISSLRVGKTTMGPNGCAVVATYNALLMLDNRIELCDIIREYEINGVSIYGTSVLYPAFIARFFKSRGYVVTVTYNVDDFDSNTVKNATANILYYTQSITGHYVALKWDSSQLKYVDYNVTSKNSRTDNIGTSIKDYLSGKYYKGRVLISISKKNNKS